ncbi:MAG: DUF2341 domain-containing protein [Planctomycetota bacterium]|nr:DUF2341 domain-containing protein [Planctomycetota bacterium]
MTGKATTLTLALLALFQTASAQYTGWQHSGSMYILTTPEGADLPAAASEEGFPLLVRLSKDGFDFTQAKAGGDDVRFADAAGKPLAYQIGEWDAAAGTASIWVRIPAIKGNAHQEIKMFWGKADAAGKSKGAAVFNESNGYLCVFHMADPVKDEVGTLEAKDTGTVGAAGVIGKSRRFDPGKGINCGENITTFTTGSSPNSSEVWFKAERVNTRVMGWGREQRDGMVALELQSPPRMKMVSGFCCADVEGSNAVVMTQWTHVVHTYAKDNSRIYINGRLEGVSTANWEPLNIESPARMYIGGWYNNYQFAGEIDEVRVSKVTRSADWVRMAYENQKPQQTLVGPLVQPGSDFSVSEKKLTISEGKSATVTAKTGGAQKSYWILKKGGGETVAAVDKPAFTIDAGRISGDQSMTLKLKAVYADTVQNIEIPVTVKEEIPDPVFTLKAPAKWDGRAAIEIVPQLSNVKEMLAKNVGGLKYEWSVSGLAVIKEVAPGKLLLNRAQNSGVLTVTARIGNGGNLVTHTVKLAVKEPAKDAWVQRTPDKDEKPVDNQFFARDDKNEGTLFYNGTLSSAADSVFLKLYADDKLVKTETQKPAADKSYALLVKLMPGLIKYKVQFGTKAGGAETVLQTVTNLVCGDAYLIDGQSNALATDTGDKSPAETSDWIRSYGGPAGKGEQLNLWCNPVWRIEKGEKAQLGWWGMELAKRLVASQKIPIFIINGAVGGTRIDQHQRNEADPTDRNTIYGRMLGRVEQARLTHGIRGVLWHQGENNQGSASPTGDFDWKSYQEYFLEMSAAWKQDFPNIQHYYIFQIWPNSYSMGNGHGAMLREKLRTLPQLYSNMGIMSTHGIRPPGPAHFPLVGWSEFARLIQPLIERDFYGKVPTASITPPNLRSASYSSAAKDAITLEFDQPVIWSDALAGQFYLDDEKDKVASGSVSGNVLTLKLKAASTAKKITYLKEMSWSQDTLLNGANGIAALTFAEVEIGAAR